MKTKKLFFLVLSVVTLLAVSVSSGTAQEPPPPGPEGGEQVSAAYISASPVMSYQGRLLENGSPVTGTKSMTFKLYDAQSAGALIWTEGPKDVAVTNGLFNVTLGDTTALPVDDLDQELWLEIEVAGTTLPRQKLMGAPYAFSLVPGADVTGNIGTGWSVLKVENEGAGIGVLARSTGTGLNGAALKADSTSDGGIAIWARNDSATSTDASLVVSNDGSGPLIKGFGSGGGEDEFRVNNDGTIETKADSYIFISGNEFIKNTDDDTIRWDSQPNGSVRIWRGSTAGSKFVYIPITLPSVLYGQPVKVEEITIYYKCLDGTQNYITNTYLLKQTDAASSVNLVNDPTDWKSNTATSYTLTVNHTLSSDTGILGLYLLLNFVDDTNYIQIGGVRLRLGHHELY